MILLDTNVLIYASDPASPFHAWARNTVIAHVSGDGAAINPVVLAELCVGDAAPDEVADRIRSWGVEILDLPAASAESCAAAYSAYRRQRKQDAGHEAPAVPLPDFFIGAHAATLRIALATADAGRYRTYFPDLKLIMPARPANR